MKIGIIGAGIVGSATAFGLKSKLNEIIVYDKFKSGYQSIKDIVSCDIVFICVPTPMKKSGEIDLSAINDSVEQLVNNNYKNIVVIKSTAVSGTTDNLAKKYADLSFAFNPEFLTEKNSLLDFLDSDRIIVGANDDNVYKKIAQIYVDAGFKCPIFHTDIKTAEMIKYMSNAFLATKVIFANEIYQICKKLDIDYREVSKLVALDERIGKSHLMVPGEDNCFGFSGTCFPKDINALIYLARENGYKPNLLEEVWRTNLLVRKNHDWLKA